MKTYSILFTLAVSLWTSLYSDAQAQNIILEVKTENQKQDSIASIYFPKRSFNNIIFLQESILNARSLLESSGYFNYEIDKLYAKSKTNYVIEFKSGKKIKNIRITTNDQRVKTYIKRLSLVNKDNYFITSINDIKGILQKFTTLEAQNEFATTSFQLKDIRIKNDEVYATLSIYRQEFTTSTNIEIKGYPKFPNSFIKHFIKLNGRSDKAYLLQKAETLYQLPFIKQLKEPEILVSDRNTTLYLYANKKNANRFEGFLGFRSGETNKNIRLNGNVEINLLNNFNYGETLNFYYNSGNDQQNLDLNTRLPFLFKSPISLSAQLNLFRKDSTFSTSSQKLNLDYFVSSQTQISAFTSFEKSTLLSTPTSLFLEDYTKNEIGFKIKLTSPTLTKISNSPVTIDLELGLIRRETLETNTIDTQFRLEFEASYLFKIAKKHQILLENIDKILESKTFYTNELFRFGGIKSIRGFKENELIANKFFLLRSEYRYLSNENIYFNTITDIVFTENKNQKTSNLLYSIGLGASIMTKAGRLKISFANGIQPNQDFTFSNTILHIGLTTQF
ncbi:hypothetical protein [Leeuwenhoekiella sp. NPDC079379]|uniref:hypothetical protein n=1 Tax=Leeuwenhoekiella sp. NPDC079379 TaxID=3364122 RepID=UPI0037CA9A73